MNGGTSQSARVLAATAPFDWDTHNARLDAQLAEIRRIAARDAEIGVAHLAALRRLREAFEGEGA
jgi:hypothetical protein